MTQDYTFVPRLWSRLGSVVKKSRSLAELGMTHASLGIACRGHGGDAVFFFGGQEVRDDIVGVGGVEEAGRREIGGEEAENFAERFGDLVIWRFGDWGERVDYGQFEGERGKAQGVAATPDLEGQDFVKEATETDVADLLGDVGLEPGVAAELPEGVDSRVPATASGNKVDVAVIETYPNRNIARLRQEIAEVSGQPGVKRRKSPGGAGREAEKKVDVAATEGGVFGEGSGEGDGFEVIAGPGAEERLQLAENAVRGGVILGNTVAVDGSEEVEIFRGQHGQVRTERA